MPCCPAHANTRLFILALWVVASGLITAGWSCKTGAVTTGPSNQNMDAAWQPIDSLMEAGLPRSAMPLVLGIQEQAQQNNNHGAYYRALVYRRDVLALSAENGLAGFIGALEQLRETEEHPVRVALVNALLGDAYHRYLQANRWRILDRSTGSGRVDADGLSTASLGDFVRSITDAYDRALAQSGALQAIPVLEFGHGLENNQTAADRALRPTLFDLVAHHALDFYQSAESGLSRPAQAFSLDHPGLFAEAARFVSHSLDRSDTLDYRYKALETYQKLCAFHSGAGRTEATLSLDLDRMAFVARESGRGDVGALYRNALETALEAHYNKPEGSLAAYALARWYADRAPGRDDAPDFTAGTGTDEGNNIQEQLYRKEAVRLATETVERWPESFGAGNARALLQHLKQQECDLILEGALLPDREALCYVAYRNLETLHFRILKSSEALEKALREGEDYQEQILRLCQETPWKQWTEKLPGRTDYNHHSVEAALPALPFGSYILLLSSEASFDPRSVPVVRADFAVTQIAYLSTPRRTGGMELYVLDRESGAPMAGVAVEAYVREYDYQTRKSVERLRDQTQSASDGLARLDAARSYESVQLVFRSGQDVFRPAEPAYLMGQQRRESAENLRSFLFTDRSIYRPGQAVYVKGIVLRERDGKPAEPVSGMRLTLSFRDANGEITASRDVETNAFGSYRAVFDAPLGGLTGSMNISDAYGAVGIRVEEYKRPKFEVVLYPPSGDPRLGDEVSLSGRAQAYSGMPLGGASVHYRVHREAYYPWWCFTGFGGWGDWSRWPAPAGQGGQEIAAGHLTCAADGTFNLTFTAIPGESASMNRWFQPQFVYRISAEVTDISGETRSGTKELYIGRSALRIELEPLSDAWVSDRLPGIKAQVLNAAGLPAKAVLTARLIALDPAPRRLRERLWPVPDEYLYPYESFRERFPHDAYGMREAAVNRKSTRVLWEATLQPGEQTLRLPKAPDWPSGEYVLLLFAEDGRGESSAVEHYLHYLKAQDARAPDHNYLYVEGGDRSLQPGETLDLRIGSAYKQAQILAELRRGDESLSRRWLEPGGGFSTWKYTVEEADRGGLDAELVFIADNRVHRITRRVQVPWSNKELKVEWERFRDKLEPGAEEHWSLRISGPGGDAAAAEGLIAMYDASLDALAPHDWSGWRFPENVSWRNWQGGGMQARNGEWISWFDRYPISTREREFDRLYSGRYGMLFAYGPRGGRRDYSMNMADAESAPAAAKSEGNAIEQSAAPAPPVSAVPPPLRSDFRETALFLPQVQTDEEGAIRFSFDVPESLTRWRILGHFYDTGLRQVLLDDTAVSSKALMVTPNFPRYLREGDRLVLSARIDNASDRSLSGTATLQLLDPESGKALNSRFGHQTDPLDWSCEAGAGTPLRWLVSVPAGVSSVRYEIRIQSEGFSDGEAGAWAVLPRNILVTETLPFTVSGAGTTEIRWDRLAELGDKSNNQLFSLEWSPNPAWYAVQALPYLMEYPHACSEQIFSRFYANSIGHWIALSDPAIAGVFAQWKADGSLLSPLEKNADLKSVLLEETPWLREAQEESAQKQRLGLLLDTERMERESAAALRELLAAQTPNGGWSWFPGGIDNPYITRHIVSGLGHLDALGIVRFELENGSGSLSASIGRALDYLDQRALEDWKMEEGKRIHAVGAADLHWLYARSFYTEYALPEELLEPLRFTMKTLVQNWNDRSITEQALLALALHRWSAAGSEWRNIAGNVPVNVLASLKERAQFSEELGMWWADNRAGYRWYEAPVETQALLIEAFGRIADDREAVEAMKVWLLAQKRTRAWPSTRATAEACYALLATGSPLLSTGNNVRVEVGGEVLSPDRAKAGTGYVRHDWGPAEINSGKASVRITRDQPGQGWGGLYWSRYANLDEVPAGDGVMQVNKRLFVEVQGERGPELFPIDGEEGRALRLGETLLTRLELISDRDLEFVHLKDGRASGLEPLDVLSGYRWENGLGYYLSVRDASTNFFIDHLPRGRWVIEYRSRAFQPGDFSAGPATFQCLYAPEFSARSGGARLNIHAPTGQ